MSDDCTHENFAANVGVHRITDGEGGPVKAYNAEIRVRCRDCGTPFQWVGVPVGLSGEHPMTSVDFQEMHAPIVPNGEHIEGLGIGYTIRMGDRT